MWPRHLREQGIGADERAAYKELEQGLARLMAGLEPVESSRSLGSLYLIINALLAISLTLVLLPLIRMQNWQHWLSEWQRAGNLPRVRVIMRSVWEIGFALLFLIGVRLFLVEGLGAQSWYEVLTVFPDFALWIWLFALTMLLTGVLRLKLIIQARQTDNKKS